MMLYLVLLQVLVLVMQTFFIDLLATLLTSAQRAYGLWSAKSFDIM